MSPFFSKLFGFDPQKHNVRTEIIAGITTFLTMAYILAVNPSIFSALADQGMPTNAVFTATALAAIIGTLVMALYAKKPFALAPGMGLNAFFVYTVCLTMGYSWQFALTAILLEGIIFIILSVTKVRDLIVKAIPDTLKKAIGAGIGLYIAFIGLQNAGIIVNDDATLVTLGDLTTANSVLFTIGLLLTSILVVLKVKGGVLIGILATTLIGIPFGITHLDGIISTPASIAPVFMKFEWSQILSLDMLIVVLTFLCIDMFDTIGTVVGVAEKANMIDKDSKVESFDKIFLADAIATTAGACLGSSTTTTYIESASGVTEGGRTGLTSFTVVVCFVLALFFSPLFLAIPSAATGAVLVVVGVMMMSPIREIDWSDYSEAIPAFITATMMPLTYSIAHGILLGIIVYVVINACTKNIKKISPAMWVLFVLFVLRYIFM
ncbi:MAG: NCS2 family permease [Bacteroidales bacterium]|nr:NCS2 family permease [Bacteroidales bacterium]MBQ4189296.1 NCS2 family permease [Bacteroidales bacterium]